MRLPTYDQILSDESQRDIIETPTDQSIFVVGPPGSGKTTLAIQRALIVAKSGAPVILVTYNRLLRQQITLLIRKPNFRGVEIETMHRFVWHAYRQFTNSQCPTIEPYKFDWTNMQQILRKQQNLESPTWHVIVDEGQDLPKEFYEFLHEFAAKHVTVFADMRQTISDVNSSLADIKAACQLDDPILLQNNHRNTPEIDRVSRFYFPSSSPLTVPHPKVIRSSSGEVPEIVFYQDIETASKYISKWHLNQGGSTGVIICRTDFGKPLYRHLASLSKNVRVDFYQSKNRNDREINLLTPGITVLNAKSAKGQEFDTVFILQIECILSNFFLKEQRLMYMLCSRARDRLFILKQGRQIPSSMSNNLPGKDILKRV